MINWKEFWFFAVPQTLFICSIVVLSAGAILRLDGPLELYLGGEDKVLGVTGELKDFLIVGKRFSDNHVYDLKNYNCVNYSRDLKSIADSLGFVTRYVEGCPVRINDSNRSCHAWLRLEVDYNPQMGKFADYSLEYPEIIKEEE